MLASTRRRPSLASVVTALLGAAVLIIVQAGPALAVSLTPVLTSPQNEEFPAANATFLAWSENSAAAPKHFDEFVRKGQNPRLKVNPSGTQGISGGIDGTTLVYQQVKNGQSNIEFFNLLTHTTTAAPLQVNTTAWERQPTLSGHFLLFGRGKPGTKEVRQVILFNTETKHSKVLATTASGLFSVVPGQVNGNFAAWWECTNTQCDDFRFNISTGAKAKVPNPNHRLNYFDAVNPDGTLYFASSGFGCGTDVKLMRFENGRVTTLLSLPQGIDVGELYAFEPSGGNTTVYVQRVTCKGNGQDVYKFVDSG